VFPLLYPTEWGGAPPPQTLISPRSTHGEHATAKLIYHPDYAQEARYQLALLVPYTYVLSTRDLSSE
jgi:hypothetical protein